MLASSNCRKEALAQRLDRRVMDRLRETCAMIEASGPNQRDQAVLRGEPREREVLTRSQLAQDWRPCQS